MSGPLQKPLSPPALRIGPYRLEKVLGRDSVGEVFLGIRVDGEFDQRVAIKLLRVGTFDEPGLERFKRERQISAALNHPNIAHFYGGGTAEDGSPYFVLEYVEGVTILDHCEQQKLNVAERLALFRQVAQATQSAHDADVLHGNLKPENILVSNDGTVKLLDFGLRRSDPEASLAPGRSVSSRYDAPEFARGEPASVAGDIYALGILLGDMLGGVAQTKEFADIRSCLEPIIARCTAEDPDKRLLSAEGICKTLEKNFEGASEDLSRSCRSALSPVIGKPTLAILPFDAEGTEHDAEAFGVGIADSLISRISRIARIVVRPTTSVLSFSSRRPFDAGRELGVDFVLAGSSRQEIGEASVSASLFNVAKRDAVWTREFRENAKDLIELEDSICRQLTGALLPELPRQDREEMHRPPTKDNEAYSAYLRGRFHWSRFTDEGLTNSLEEFKLAVTLDPEFLLPYIGIADFYIWSSIFGELPSADAFPKAESAIDKALTIDDGSAEALSRKAFIELLWRRDWREAERLARLALESNPDTPFAHECLSNIFCSMGVADEAISEILKAESLDPLSPRAVLMSSWTYYLCGRNAEAIQKARKAFEMEPGMPQAMLHLGNVLTEAGEYDEAVKLLRLSAESWKAAGLPRYMLAFARAGQGDQESVAKIVAKLEEIDGTGHVKPYFLAMAHLAAGNRDRAFEYFQRALREGDEWMVWFGVDPKLNVIRSDPRYRDLLGRTGNPIALETSVAPRTDGRELSIAVLPFRLIGSTAPAFGLPEFLGTALADALTLRLSNVRKLKVRPTSSVVVSAGRHDDPFVCGEELDVKFIVDGILRTATEGIRLTVQLLDVRERSVRWSASFYESTVDLLDLEDSISEQVTRSLLTQIDDEMASQLAKRGTTNPAALDAYLQGRFFWSQFSPETFPKTLASFERAIELDPEFAAAHAGLADFNGWALIYGLIPPEIALPQMLVNLERALEIDPSLAEAHAALGLYHSNMQEWDKSEECYRRAIELNPNYPLGHEWLSSYLVGSGRTSEGLQELDTAESLDPLSLRPKVLTAWTYYQARDYSRSVAKCDELLSLAPNSMQSHVQACNTLLQAGSVEEALRHGLIAEDLSPDSPLILHPLCFALAASGRIAEARDRIDRWQKIAAERYVGSYFFALAYFSIGEYDLGFESLDAAQKEFNPWMIWTAVEPKLDSIRGDERYGEILRRMNGPILP